MELFSVYTRWTPQRFRGIDYLLQLRGAGAIDSHEVIIRWTLSAGGCSGFDTYLHREYREPPPFEKR